MLDLHHETSPHGRATRSHHLTKEKQSCTHTNDKCGQAVIYENACGQSSYVCELVHYAREPQLHVSLPPRARQQHDGAQLDGDDARRHGGERRLSDDAPGPCFGACAILEFLPFVTERIENADIPKMVPMAALSGLRERIIAPTAMRLGLPAAPMGRRPMHSSY